MWVAHMDPTCWPFMAPNGPHMQLFIGDIGSGIELYQMIAIVLKFYEFCLHLTELRGQYTIYKAKIKKIVKKIFLQKRIYQQLQNPHQTEKKVKFCVFAM